ncbi:unnamed protein product [Rotaria magnacalcarata]|uniref:Uncharacterized protein n=1 Tax=Rotaria magnacalcarata TaxID=392030 RepID=A0A8S2NZH8_9BILA|nr:unnamed protein product [Rotaria magnacalcarata]
MLDFRKSRNSNLFTSKTPFVENRFPSIDDVANEAGADLQEAKEFTELILHDLGSGEVTDRTSACHTLKRLLESQNLSCLFFDSTHGKNLHDSSEHLTEFVSEDRPFVLKLKSSEGLCGSKRQNTEHDTIRFVQTLNKSIEEEQLHPVIKDMLERFSEVHGIDKSCIPIKPSSLELLIYSLYCDRFGTFCNKIAFGSFTKTKKINSHNL